MAINTNTIKTRIQLKSDTEANWNKAGPKEGSLGFIPLRGELIIYSADSTHAFSRLKVGDGTTNIVDLPFIDSGTLNGAEVEFVKKETFNQFPLSGSPDKLYIDLSTNKIYHYAGSSGYTQLSNFEFQVDKTTINNIISWDAGTMSTVSLLNNKLIFNNGSIPELSYESEQVVSNITQQGANNI